MADNTSGMQHHGFKPGQSGNPKGRPRGSRNKATLAAEALLDGEAEAITRKCIELALGGNIHALRICMDRICPPRKERPVAVKLPRVTSAEDLSKLTAAMVNAVARGELDPQQAASMAALVSAHGRALHAVEIEHKLASLAETGGVKLCWLALEQAGGGDELPNG